MALQMKSEYKQLITALIWNAPLARQRVIPYAYKKRTKFLIAARLRVTSICHVVTLLYQDYSIFGSKTQSGPESNRKNQLKANRLLLWHIYHWKQFIVYAPRYQLIAFLKRDSNTALCKRRVLRVVFRIRRLDITRVLRQCHIDVKYYKLVVSQRIMVSVIYIRWH